VRKLALAPALAVVLCAPALAFQGSVTKRADLDGDAPEEAVSSVRVDIPGVADEFDQTEIRVSDTCGSTPISRRIAGPQDNLAKLRLRRIDTRSGADVFVDLRSGAAGRLGEARVVAWRRRSGATCRGPRNLFRYKADKPTRRPRGTTGEVSTFAARVVERAARYRAREVVLTEFFLAESDPACCGSVKKVTYWRYSRGRDKYVRYRTKLRRLN
jgi:hypothetical protein